MANSVLEKELVIIDELPTKPSWVTVIVGENGTQKSFLLLKIAQQVGKALREFRPLSDQIRIKNAGFSQLIALSRTPLDRFPRQSSRAARAFEREPPYTYFGQRALNGVAGSGASARNLVAALLGKRTALKNRASEFESIFGQLGLQPAVHVLFDVASKWTDVTYVDGERKVSLTSLARLKVTLGIVCDRFREGFPAGSREHSDALIVLKYIQVKKSMQRIEEIILSLSDDDEPQIYIHPNRTYSKTDTFSIAVWRMLFEAGILEITGTKFFAKKGHGSHWLKDVIPGRYLSSGQWSWLCTLGGLAAQITDGSLILIDEPENSLHPAWQRAYVPMLLKILNSTSGCQAILTTHAPLIASGLPPGSGNTRRLIRDITEESVTIRSEAALNTFGWSATDAYEVLFEIETTRAAIFTKEATEALHMIRDQNGALERQTELLDVLLVHQESLPEFDSMRHVLEGITADLTKLIGGSKL
ncbi:ATP-binding protein [Herbaspirillum huttiense]|uniref:AAA family ATPase n=1 Tax=Herbaspirillum huttiense TaxID=863372 RepID=A0AAJ2HBW7_9BURK|nr:AAA family ATPase [Herbaspirillum huttiense]MDR9837641.1 AAA family ATPase [Herbaspirillum huttiense]